MLFVWINWNDILYLNIFLCLSGIGHCKVWYAGSVSRQNSDNCGVESCLRITVKRIMTSGLKIFHMIILTSQASPRWRHWEEFVIQWDQKQTTVRVPGCSSANYPSTISEILTNISQSLLLVNNLNTRSNVSGNTLMFAGWNGVMESRQGSRSAEGIIAGRCAGLEIKAIIDDLIVYIHCFWLRFYLFFSKHYKNPML